MQFLIFLLLCQICISTGMYTNMLSLEQLKHRLNHEMLEIAETKTKMASKLNKALSGNEMHEWLHIIQLQFSILGDAIQNPHLQNFVTIEEKMPDEVMDLMNTILAASNLAPSTSTASASIPLLPSNEIITFFEREFENFLKELQKPKNHIHSAVKSSGQIQIISELKQMKGKQSDQIKAKRELWGTLLHDGIVPYAELMDTHLLVLNDAVEKAHNHLFTVQKYGLLEKYWKLHLFEELAKSSFNLLNSIWWYGNRHEGDNAEANELFDKMGNAYKALGKRLDWLLGRNGSKVAGDNVAIDRFMAKQLKLYLDSSVQQKSGIAVLSQAEDNIMEIFAKLTGHQYQPNNPMEKQEWQLLLLVGYVLHLYYLEEDNRYQYNPKTDMDVDGLNPEEAMDASSFSNENSLEYFNFMNGILDNAPMFKEEYQEKSLYPDKFAELFLPPEGLIAFAETFDTLIVRQNQLKSKLETELEGGEDVEALGNKIRKKLEDILNEMDRGEFTLKTIVPNLYNKLPHFNFDTNAIKGFIKKSMAEILTENDESNHVRSELQKLKYYLHHVHHTVVQERPECEMHIIGGTDDVQAQQLLLNTLDSVIQTFESIDGDIEEIKRLFEHGIAVFKRRKSWVAHQHWERDLERRSSMQSQLFKSYNNFLGFLNAPLNCMLPFKCGMCTRMMLHRGKQRRNGKNFKQF